MTTFSAAGGGGLVGVAAFPLQCQWICTMMMCYPAPTDGRYSNGLRCLILLICHMCLIFMYTSFYSLVSLVSVLLRPTTSLLWLILSVPMCIDVTMCMLILLFYDSCAMLALCASIKFLLTYINLCAHMRSTVSMSWYFFEQRCRRIHKKKFVREISTSDKISVAYYSTSWLLIIISRRINHYIQQCSVGMVNGTSHDIQQWWPNSPAHICVIMGRMLAYNANSPIYLGVTWFICM